MTPVASVTALRAQLDGIWRTAPGDLAHVATVQRPPSRDMVKRLYANADVYWIAQCFFIVGQRLRAGQPGWAEITRLLADMAPTLSARLKLWEFTDAADALTTAAGGLSTVGSLGEALEIIDALVLYLQRVQGWVDATIPWAALDAVAPLAIRETAR